MTNETDARGVFNPLLMWTDMSMRATEMTLASLQNMTEGADRLTRAGASAEVEEPPEDDGLGGFGGMQRLMWDLMTQSWLRWASAFGTLLSASAGVGVARKVAGQENPLNAVHDSLLPATWGEHAASGRRAQRDDVSDSRASRARENDAQHAQAAAEARPRRKAATKRRAQRSARK